MITAGLPELLNYSDHERAKWRAWVAADPLRLFIPFQPGGRFPTIGSVFDHVFLVERRHLARLQGGTPPDATGVPVGDADGLFEYGDLVRDDFRQFVTTMSNAAASQTITFSIPTGSVAMTRRRLATHVVLHEVRHFAQVALAARIAGVAPPGEHDLFFYSEFD